MGGKKKEKKAKEVDVDDNSDDEDKIIVEPKAGVRGRKKKTETEKPAKTEKKLDKDRFRNNLGDLIPAYTEVAKRLGILHEQSNVSAVNVTKLSSIKRKRK